MLFSQNKSSSFHPSLSFNDTEVNKVNGRKHLGLTMFFEKHITEKIKTSQNGVTPNISRNIFLSKRLIKCIKH